MSTEPSGCPDPALLEALVAGSVSEAARDGVEQHLESCASCQKLVADALRSMPTVGDAGRDTEPRGPERKPFGRLGGRYVLLGCLGRGGMGTVYDAWDAELARRVALKILNPGAAHERLQREAQALARLKHPGVVTIYDVGRDGGEVFITMELVDGEPLRRWLAAAARPWQQVLDVFLDAGRALAAAHAAGLVHRDFKPENVLVGHDGSVRVVDFGLSLPIDDHVAGPSLLSSLDSSDARITHTGAVLGTPRYMAPEQREARPASPRSDQFSFCVALWEALYGEHPVVVDGTGTPAVGRVPAWVRTALRRGMASDAAARWPSMEPLLHALGRRSGARQGLLALGAAALLVAAVTAWPRDDSAARACAASAREAAGGWGEPERAALRRAFTASGQPGANEAAAATEAALDRYAAALSAMAGEACSAARVRRVQSAELYGLRAQCLTRRQRGMGALVAELVRADGPLVQRAEEAARSLPDLAECADAGALAAPMQVPADPRQRAPVAAARAVLAEIDAMVLSGRAVPAIVRAAALLPVAGGIGYRPLVAEALVQLGSAQLAAERDAEAVDEQAVLVAQAAGHDRMTIDALLGLARTITVGGARMVEAQRWLRLADATLIRLGTGREAEMRRGQLETMRARLAQNSRDWPTAEAHARRALASALRWEPETRRVFSARLALVQALHSQRKLVEAEVLVRENLAHALRTGLGPFDRAQMANLLGLILSDEHRWEESEKENRRALELARVALGPDSRLEASIEVNLSLLYIWQGRRAEALPVMERAVALMERTLGPSSPKLANVLANLGRLNEEVGRLDDARRALERARSIIVAEEGPGGARILQILGSLIRVATRQGRLAEAHDLAEQASVLAEKRGLHDSEYIGAMAAAAFAYRDDARTALPRYRKAMAAHEELYGAMHESSFTMREEMAPAEAEAGDRQRAWELLDGAYRIKAAALSASSQLLLAELDRERGDHERAERLLAAACAPEGRERLTSSARRVCAPAEIRSARLRRSASPPR